MKTKAKQKSRYSDKDAKTIKSFLQKNFPGGVFEAREVLELARPKNSPIHRYFEWDDTEAAEKYRLLQAKKMIQCVVVEVDGEEIRKYVSPVIVNARGDKRYCELELARNTPDIWQQVLVRAMEEAAAYRRRYLRFKELSLVHEAIEQTIKKHGVRE